MEEGFSPWWWWCLDALIILAAYNQLIPALIAQQLSFHGIKFVRLNDAQDTDSVYALLLIKWLNSLQIFEGEASRRAKAAGNSKHDIKVPVVMGTVSFIYAIF